MRIATLVFAASLAAIAALAAPALAKSADRQKTDDKSTITSAGCQAYQQTADGSWTQLPCGESGSSGAAPSRSATKGADDSEH